MMEDKRGTEVWIDPEAVRANTRLFRDVVGSQVKVMAVVKADGYGHGALRVARAALEAGAGALGVATVLEGRALRDGGIDAPILVLGAVNAGEAEAALEMNLDVTVFHDAWWEALVRAAERLGRRVRVHLKVDTGMGRLGVTPAEALQIWVPRIVNHPLVKWQGLMSHLACSDVPDTLPTRQQLRQFLDVIEAIRASKTALPPDIHVANTAATLRFPGTHFTMVRVGLGLYGAVPYAGAPALTPALTWVSRVTQVKRVTPGFAIGYHHTYRAEADETIATVAVGYADGYRRALSNRAEVLIHGRRCPVVGRISMDQLTVRVPEGLAVQPGDVVVLAGRDGAAEVAMEELADWADTISYEMLTSISARVPRHWDRFQS